jgi:hypothetical protein
MKKLLAYAVIFSVLAFGACKKAEEKKEAASQPQQQQAKPTDAFKPQGKKNRKKPTQTAAPTALVIYNESNVVTSIPQSQYDTMATAKLKVNNKEVKAVLMKDLLSKYSVKGKNVILGGEETKTALTWDQANAADLYVYVTPKKVVKVYSASKTMADMKFPKRLQSITVSATVEAAKPATVKPKTTT